MKPRQIVNEKPPRFKIRAHHLLCMQGFQGLGYSPKFVQNFQEILDQVKSHFYETLFEVTDSIDSLCEPCPHHKDGLCQKDQEAQERIQSMDRAVLKKLELKNGAQQKAESLFALANARLRSQSDVTDICDHCEWRHKCLWYGRLKQNH